MASDFAWDRECTALRVELGQAKVELSKTAPLQALFALLVEALNAPDLGTNLKSSDHLSAVRRVAEDVLAGKPVHPLDLRSPALEAWVEKFKMPVREYPAPAAPEVQHVG